jgi:pSer/pThr/pTyr-binding forkhead associated (FHA) protein
MASFQEMIKRPSKEKPVSSMKTKTVPEDRRDGFFEGPDPVTWIHIPGTVHQFELPKQLKNITLGSAPDCDIVVPSAYLSRHHCTIERGFGGIRIHDHSKNGTYVEGRRIDREKDVRPGEIFGAGGGISFIALNDEMRRVYPLLSDLLDWETETSLVPPAPRWPTPCDVIRLASGVDHLMISGDRGCDQDRLAHAIHAMSPLRSREIVWVDSIPEDRGAQKELLVRASRSTMVLKIDDEMPVMDEAFRSSLFSTSYRVRVLVIAWPTRARAVLGEDNSTMRRIELRPIAYRDQLDRLLDRQLEERKAPLRFAQMTEANRKALLRYEWRGNFDELRLAAERFAAVAREGSLRKASTALGESYSTLQHWFTNMIGVSLPLTNG